jgi:HAD superfamily hydrolase (TIGR01509 family)
MPDAVIFDLDGVLMDSEQLWNQAKRDLVREAGGRWRDEAPQAMMGMSSPEWSTYMRERLAVPMEADAINRDVVRRMQEGYDRELPLLPGSREVVERLGERWPLGLASSANREIIDLFLELSSFADAFGVTVSSEEVACGKPAPDVYLHAARGLGADPRRCVAVEDSGNGLRAAAAAGTSVIAVPNPHYPPDDEALALAAATVASVAEISVGLVERVARGGPARDGPQCSGQISRGRLTCS